VAIIFQMNRLSMLDNQVKPDPSFWIMKDVVGFEFEKLGNLKGKTLLITGASRGIGLAIGVKAAKDGANVAILAKTVTPQPNLPGTIYTAAEDIKQAGGKALPIVCDARDEMQIKDAVQKTVDTFGGIDILINNVSALY
jgi:citronellol/citronellal dehydrogenase